jgi:hypothetical protein
MPSLKSIAKIEKEKLINWIWHLLQARKIVKKYYFTQLVAPEYQNKGVHAIILTTIMKLQKIINLRQNPELADNFM